MKFDVVIGNPPYQAEKLDNGRKPPIYHYFMNEAYKIGKTVELITPARFLFDAGQTPSEWNKKMLEDEHFKVLHYEENGSNVFPGTDIKGGVAITIRDISKHYGKIHTFTTNETLNGIVAKVWNKEKKIDNLSSIVSSRGTYRLTTFFFDEIVNAKKQLESGTGNMLVTNIFDKLPEAFTERGDEQKVKILGRQSNERIYRYIDKRYIENNVFLGTYNLAYPKSNGSGKFGETISLPAILGPGEGATDTFINIGNFESLFEVMSLSKYVKSKFGRALLNVRKVTQDNPKSVWQQVPLQDFTEKSDIDWSASVANIDKQLYKKYGLTEEEIKFIEENVKEMV